MLSIAPFVAVVMAVSAAPPVVNHAIDVKLDTAAGTVEVTDTLTLPAPALTADLALHADLAVTPLDASVVMKSTAVEGFAVPAQRVHLEMKTATAKIALRYSGQIVHAPEQVASESQRTFQETPGTIES